MPDNKYCYPNSEVLKNKLNITDRHELFEAEKELTAIRLRELQEDVYDSIYHAKISEMDAKKKISDAKETLKKL